MPIFKKTPKILPTPWTDQINRELPWPEYPRPQLQRASWQNLNGLWHFKKTRKNASFPGTFPETILVPYPIESMLSGVGKPLLPSERLWYQKNFQIYSDLKGKRVLLNFGAVDWESDIYINKIKVGTHRGGYCPFSFDITDYLQPGDNSIVVSVWDPTDKGKQEHGKQVLTPNFIWYTAVSGIWQTVWLEVVSEHYIDHLYIQPDLDRELIKIDIEIADLIPDLTLNIDIKQIDVLISKKVDQTTTNIEIPITQPKLWSPENPYLYDVDISLGKDGERLDHVQSYFGMRKISIGKDKQGNTRMMLNNEPYFQLGVLDQGYWPDGLYTPPTDDAMRFDIEYLKKSGFNMIRKHVKVEPARYYYYCDRLGMIVWQDLINGGRTPKKLWFVGKNNSSKFDDKKGYKQVGRNSIKNRHQFEKELKELINHLKFFTSIAVWVPFNEGWGQFDSVRMTNLIKNIDQGRLVDHASGWFDQGEGDFKSIHRYFKPLTTLQSEKLRAVVLSEFGGYSLFLSDHVWDEHKIFGYKSFQNKKDMLIAYQTILKKELLPWVKQGLSASVFTQTTDVEIEINGLLSYDRKVIKLNSDDVRELHRAIIDASPN